MGKIACVRVSRLILLAESPSVINTSFSFGFLLEAVFSFEANTNLPALDVFSAFLLAFLSLIAFSRFFFD